ncbi:MULTISPECIES: hypothetical protein [Winogradskyella]|uniref:Uncharacterized protein n=1 Tax=Winogradskyella damuponensis TaxID=943939 RepID=A0ABP8CYK1_9FLAO
MKWLEKDNIIGIVLILCYLICVSLLAIFIYQKTIENEEFLNSYIKYMFIAFFPIGLLLIFSEKIVKKMTISEKLKESIPLISVALFSIPFISGIVAWISYLFTIVIVLIVAFWKILLIALIILLVLIFGSLIKDKFFKQKQSQ